MATDITYSRIYPLLSDDDHTYKVWEPGRVIGYATKDGPHRWIAYPTDATRRALGVFRTRGDAGVAVMHDENERRRRRAKG